MEFQSASIDHRKRQRRRRLERHAVSARLILNHKVDGDVGRISDDLFETLFSHVPSSKSTEIKYVAITPWAPVLPESISDEIWTILPVKTQKTDDQDGFGLYPASILFSISYPGVQTFTKSLQAYPSIRENSKAKLNLEIRVLDVEPLVLDTVFVTVDGNALNRHDEIQRQFGGGFDRSSTNGYIITRKTKISFKNSVAPAEPAPDNQQERLISATREALEKCKIVRQGEFLSLPFPTHPITHVPFPPAKISFCEPCSQGLLCWNTEVILNRGSTKTREGRGLPLESHSYRNGALTEEDETSNEQFFSALEDKIASTPKSSGTKAEIFSSNSSEKDSSSQSDDSLDGVISIGPPGLPPDLSDARSFTAAITPKLAGLRPSGFSTPGSINSNFTARTARQGLIGDGKLFRSKCLLGRVPDGAIHPKPSDDEDEESRIFVDIKMLLKLGCFSGDWVKVENIEVPSATQGHFRIEALTNGDGALIKSRLMKVYGLSDFSQKRKARYFRGSVAKNRSGTDDATSETQLVPEAWFSPILFVNLGQPSTVRLSPLPDTYLGKLRDSTSFSHKPGETKPSNSLSPPVAREVTLLKVSTPLVTERALQKGLHMALQKYLEFKCRILRKGDLVPLVIDTEINRILARSSTAADIDQDIEEFLSFSCGQANKSDWFGVAWFRVSKVVISRDEQDQFTDSAAIWGGMVCVEPSITRTVQGQGTEQCKIPSPLEIPWEYYLGVKAPPKPFVHTKNLGNILSNMPQPYVSLLRRRLRELIATGTSVRAISLGMKPMLILLHSTQRSIGKTMTTLRASSDVGNHVFPIDAYELLSEGGSGGGDYKTEEIFKHQVERALSCGPEFTTVLIRHIEALTADRMVSALQNVIKNVRVFIATTTELEKIPEGIRSLFTHELEFQAPDEKGRECILREIIEERNIKLAHDVDLTAIAIKTAALVAGDLVDIVERAIAARQIRLDALIEKHSSAVEKPDLLIRDLFVSGGESIRCVTKLDFAIAVDAARKNFADSIGAPKIPNVGWDDVGGLENVKDIVVETIQLPLERPELFAQGMKKRSGVLFYGPPGTGKTLLAKAIATEFSLNFFSVKGPELLNMYIGESEANVRRVFQKARDAKPCVVFFDELDSVAPKRGNQGDSGGVMDRIVSQLLAELDGMSNGGDGDGGVFVIGATNRPDLLDQALLRPGRFDKMLYLGVSDSHEKQLTILEALTRKFTLDPSLSLRRIADSLPFTYTGADLYALCSDAMLKAITRQASAVDEKIKTLPGSPMTTAYFFDHLATTNDITVIVTEADFSSAQHELVGSVRSVTETSADPISSIPPQRLSTNTPSFSQRQRTRTLQARSPRLRRHRNRPIPRSLKNPSRPQKPTRRKPHPLTPPPKTEIHIQIQHSETRSQRQR